MMERLTARAEALAATRRNRAIERLSASMKDIFGPGAVEVLDAKILVRKRGLIRRWLVDPGLRFLSRTVR